MYYAKRDMSNGNHCVHMDFKWTLGTLCCESDYVACLGRAGSVGPAYPAQGLINPYPALPRPGIQKPQQLWSVRVDPGKTELSQIAFDKKEGGMV